MDTTSGVKSGHLLMLIAFIAICELVGLLGSVVSMPVMSSWYAGFVKPWFNPPGWIFGPVWTTLYAIMGLAAFLVWREIAEGRSGRMPLVLFFIQLGLNGLWTPLFFGAHRIGMALADIVLLWLVLVATTIAFFRVSRWAGALMLPYLAWVSYATALNYSLWRLNPV